jgi:hypothetical protein
MTKKYLKNKYKWVRKNPIKSAWIGFFKGIVYTIIVYELILN